MLAVVGIVGAALGATGATRPEQLLADGWRFHFGAVSNAETAVSESTAWPVVTVPHTWNIQDGADGGADYARGDGWYVREFAPDRDWRGRQLFLQFDAASRVAEVFVNGQRLGEHRGGFARFRFNITNAVRWDAANVLVVRVSNAKDGLPPISADFTFFGGLYRPVRLFATDSLHLNALDYGADAAYVEQKSITANRADVMVSAQIRNDRSDPAPSVIVRFALLDAQGNSVATAERELSVAAGALERCQVPVTIDRPHLWNGRHDPYLYTAVFSVWSAGKLCDEVRQRVGLRSYRVDADHGFFLNGEHLDLHGFSRHQDRIGKGWAIAPADDREDFEIVKEVGATAMRVAHYPQSDLWFDLADENGIITWAEIPMVNEVAATPEFADNAKQQLHELIRQHFNHPSICFWGVGNETRELNETGERKPNAPTADRVIGELAALAHQEDPTRLSTYASNHRADDVRSFHTDVIAFNKYFGWYNGKTSELASFLDEAHARFPQLRIGISEYGAGASIRQHDAGTAQPKTTGPWHPEEYQANLHEQQWQILAARPYVWGKFVWNLFDFASDGRHEGDEMGLNDKGLVTYDRKTKKDAFFWYKANWSDEPVLYITGRRFVDRADEKMEVKVYSNAPQAELWLNGVSAGVVTSSDHVFRWNVTLAPGENQVTARAQRGSQPLVDECTFRLLPKAKPGDVDVYVTAKDSADLLARQQPLTLAAETTHTEKQPVVFVDAGKRFQTIVGIGGALTDAAAETWAKLPEPKRLELIRAYYDPNVGIGYSLGRTTIHSCDFSSDSYTYVAEGDAALKSFSIAHDERYRIPLIRAAIAASRGQLTLFASPWSPPAWMKDNNDMLHGGHLRPEFRAAWAKYFVAFLDAYNKAGIAIWGVTVQNEPMAVQKWESCVFTAEEERDFVRDYLGPTLAKSAFPGTKIIAWDHNRTWMYHRAQVMLDDPAAARFIWGIGFHWYVEDGFENTRRVKEAYPNTHLLFTEGCNYPFDRTKLGEWRLGETYGRAMINDFNAGTEGWTDWNIVLDQQGGPNHVGNYCYAPVHADTKTGELTFTNAYYYLGHFSKFVRPGAQRIVSASTTDVLATTAFRNVDGTIVVIVMNGSDKAQAFRLNLAGRAAAASSPAHSIITFVVR
jgi:O-glycosyl hydrolase/beta-galactosidase/beta-glucuronidase